MATKNTKNTNVQITAEEAASAKAYRKPASEELVEAVVETANTALDTEVLSVEDITGLTPADIVDTLFMKVVDGEFFTGKYNLYLHDMFPKINVRLGNKEYKYAMLDDSSDVLAIDADNTMDDFNGEYVPEFAELFTLDGVFHKKVKVPLMVLSNAWTTAENMVEFVQLQVESMYKAIARRYESKLWSTVFENTYTVEKEFGTEAIEYSKELVNQVASLETTSNEHACIGTNGVITISTVQGDKTIQEDLQFDFNEFVLFIDKSQFVDETFVNEAQWYNYAVTKQSWAKTVVMDFSKYAGFRAIKNSVDGTELVPAVEVPTGLKMIAIHKDFVQMLEQFEYTANLEGRGPWNIFHMHSKFDVYRVKTKPAIAIVEAAEVVEPESKKITVRKKEQLKK